MRTFLVGALIVFIADFEECFLQGKSSMDGTNFFLLILFGAIMCLLQDIKEINR